MRPCELMQQSCFSYIAILLLLLLGAVRPIGVSEVIKRIIGKCVMSFAKKDVVEASGSLQLCAGQKSGSEAAIHAMHAIYIWLMKLMVCC